VPKNTGTIHIKWVRSGIGFTRKQKEMVRSIGLKRLNQVIERPDTVYFRGLVAKISHLVEVVNPAEAPAWAGVPEYKIIPVVEAPAKATPSAKKAGAAKEAHADGPFSDKDVAAKEKGPQKEKEKVTAPAGKPSAAKGRVTKSSEAKGAAGSAKPAAKRKAAPAKSAASDKKESKPKKGKK
jgi:large subunit ribosomal protein L30